MSRASSGVPFLALASVFLFPSLLVAEGGEPLREVPHPRLYFTPERISHLRSRIEKEPRIREAWGSLLRRADRFRDEELVSLEYAEGGAGQHGNYGRPSGQIAGMGATLGLAYLVTGKKEYAEKLRRALLHYTRLKRWAGDAGWDPPWDSELNTARFCFGYAVGYDSIHGDLSPEDRQTIVAALVEKGILATLDDWLLPGKRIHALDSMGHNWWSVCVAMAGVASLAVLEEEPRAREWVERIGEAFPEWFAYRGNILQNKSPNFDRKGAFYESVIYANYALSEYLLFHLARSSALPGIAAPEIPLLEKVGDFFIHTGYPTSGPFLSVNFGDSSLESTGARTLQLLLATGFEGSEYHWYLTRTEEGLDDPIGLVHHAVQPVEEPPDTLPLSMLYPDIGWATLRTSWRDDATLLAVKSGFAWNHAHPDAGSFIVFHGGRPLIIDSGNCSYSRREYTSYYRQSRAHNVVLIDGEAQNPEDVSRGDRGVVHPGSLHYLLDLSGMRHLLADATGPTSWKFSRNYRSFLWIDDAILIIDDLRSHVPGELEWTLHYEGEAREEEDGIRLENGESSRALVRPLFPAFPGKLDLVRRKGLRDHDPDTEVDYLGLRLHETREQKFITAVLPLERGEEASRSSLELLEGDEFLGVRISREEEVTEVYLNLRADGRRMHRNSNKTIRGWDTDAYLFAVTRRKDRLDEPRAIERCLVAGGSYLRGGSSVLLESLSKLHAVCAWRGNELEVVLEGQPLIDAEIHAPGRPERVTVNGETVETRWNGDRKTVRFRREGASDRW